MCTQSTVTVSISLYLVFFWSIMNMIIVQTRPVKAELKQRQQCSSAHSYFVGKLWRSPRGPCQLQKYLLSVSVIHEYVCYEGKPVQIELLYFKTMLLSYPTQLLTTHSGYIFKQPYYSIVCLTWNLKLSNGKRIKLLLLFFFVKNMNLRELEGEGEWIIMYFQGGSKL